MDQLQSIRVFEKVIEQGSFVAAGDALNMSTAMITRHIANLEKHLGARLLNRTTRSLSLTEIGKVYFERTRQILQAVDDADAIVTAQSQTPSGTLRIYSGTNFGHAQLPQLLPDYAQQFPDVRVDVTMSDHSVDLVAEGYDVGIFTGCERFDANMIARQLGVAEVMLCASPDYIQKHGVPSAPEEVSNHACLNFSYEQLRDHWPINGGNGPAANVPINSRVVSNNGELLRQSAMRGLGIVMCLSYCGGEGLRQGRLVRLFPDQRLGQIPVVLVYPSRRLLPAKMRSFVEFMCARFPNPSADPWLMKEESAGTIAELAA